MPLDGRLSEHWRVAQGELFPWLEEHVGPLGSHHRLLVTALEFVRVERFVPASSHWAGRRPACLAALARAFLAKAIFALPMTVMLRERLLVDKVLRRICGWERAGQVPSEATFSRAFAEFAASALPERAHAALVEARLGGCLIGHISRDGTAIPARERPLPAPRPRRPEKRRGRGRPRQGEIVEKPVRRLETQPGMSLEAMLTDLPRACSIGNRKNAKGYKEFWHGYRLHIDVADGDIPVSCLLTGAHVHDSQAAIPLAVMTARRVTNLYDLMDSAYDAREIHDHSRSLGHVPVIDPVPRSKAAKDAWAMEKKARQQIAWKPAEAMRLAQRTSCERVNSRLKDQFGGHHVRVRGPTKAMCHLMFGILALTVDQLTRLVT
jgi:hypothetical protein